MNATAQFLESVAANVAHWRRRTDSLTEQKLRTLDDERQNLLRAVEFGLAFPQTWRPTAELALQSFLFIERRSYGREWIPMLRRALLKCSDTELSLKGRILDQLGILLRLDWQWKAAVSSHLEEEEIGLRLGDLSRLAHARLNLSEAYRLGRAYEQAETCGLAAHQAFTNLGANPDKIASALVNLGLIAQERGQQALAEERLKAAVSHWREVNRPLPLARTLNNLAVSLEAQGKFHEAIEVYQEATTLLASTDSELDKVTVQLSLGTLYFNQGQLTEAEDAFHAANSAYLRQSGHIYYRALVANNLGNVYLKQHRLPEAEAMLLDSLAHWSSLDLPVMQANTVGTLAETWLAQGNAPQALTYYNQALHLLADYPNDHFAQHLHKKFIAAYEKLASEISPGAS
jgi:tetratricopeptide (TPR) repeat protein